MIPKGFQKGASRQIKKEMQTQLKEWGYYDGSIDGVFGPVSRRALENFLEEYRAELKSMAPYTVKITIKQWPEEDTKDNEELYDLRAHLNTGVNCQWEHKIWKAKNDYSSFFFGCIIRGKNWNSNGFALVKYANGTKSLNFFGPKGWDDMERIR